MKLITRMICLSMLTIMLSTFSCGDDLELNGDEDRALLLRKASIAWKTPCWPESCSTRYPSCPLSRERRAQTALMARLTDQIGPRYSSSNQVKEKLLALYTDTCSHPVCTAATASALTAFIILDTLNYFNEAGVLGKLFGCCRVPLAFGCGFIIDHCCRDYLTDPQHWDHDADNDFEQPQQAVMQEMYDVLDNPETDLRCLHYANIFDHPLRCRLL